MIKFFLFVFSVLNVSLAEDIHLDTIYADAEKSHKIVLVILHKPHCGYCEQMVDFTLTDDDVVESIEKDFVLVDMNIGDSGKVIFDDFTGTKKEFAISIGYNFYPSSVFIAGDKEIVFAQYGYKDEEYFLKVLRFVKSRSYEHMAVDNFK